MNIKQKIYDFIDGVMNPPISMLNLAIEKLRSIQLVTSQGLNVGKYLSVFGDMPHAWQMVISSLLLSTVLLGSLLIIRSIIRIYYAGKDGVKWW